MDMTPDFSSPQPSSDQPPTQTLEGMPILSLFTMFRLGLVQMSLGIMAILMLGILNQIMINDLAIPATIVGGSIAMYQVVAPSRVWFGQLSDLKPILGLHRTPYVWIGTGLFTALSFGIVQIVWGLNASIEAVGWTGLSYAWVALLAAAFAVYGLCVSSTSTPFFALLVDSSDDSNRGKLVGIVWSMLTIGIALGAGVGGGLLRGVDPSTLQDAINRLFSIVPACVFGLVVIATWGIESKYSRFQERVQAQGSLPEREDRVTLGRAWRVVSASRQTGIFFGFLVLLILGMFLQQPILEPFGREVFGLDASGSALLNIYWSLGSLVSLSLTGFVFVPRWGKIPIARLGCGLLIASLLGLVASGFSGDINVLRLALVFFGVAIGVATGGSISLMLDLTTPRTSGTFTGLWGLAQAMAQAISTLLGGALLDLGRLIFEIPRLAYGFPFVIEMLILLAAIGVLGRVNVEQFRADTQRAILGSEATEPETGSLALSSESD